jgi:hypothetical protein
MNRNLAGRWFVCLAAGFFIIASIFTIGCAGSKIKVEYDNKDKSGYSKADHKHKHKKHKPPPHAPAHGYRGKQKHHYRYYPSCSVYYDSGRKLYFYLNGGNWKVGSSLPRSIRASLGGFVSMELDTGKPYAHHADHVKKYPPRKKKKKKKKKSKRS